MLSEMHDTRAADGANGIPRLVERLFAPIESRLWAAALASDLGKALLVVAVVQAGLAWARNPVALVQAGLYVVAGALLWLTPTRLGALLAVLTAASSLIVTLAGLLGSTPLPGGHSILLDLPALWVAGRALAATLAFRRFCRAGEAASDEVHGSTSPDTP